MFQTKTSRGAHASARQLVAGVDGYCGNYKFSPTLKDRPGETRTEWYLVHGGKDNPQSSRRACNERKALGDAPSSVRWMDMATPT